MKLAIGQRGKREGWVTLDAHPRSNADLVGGVPPIPDSVEPDSCEVIEMIHFLEHLFLWDARELLKECHRCLKVGGKVVIECPNIDYACKVLTGQVTAPGGHADQFDMWPLYGDPSHKDPLYGHRWGYTPETLANELEQAGFPGIGIARSSARSHFPIRDFRIEATKF